MTYYLILITGVYYGMISTVLPNQYTSKERCEEVGKAWIVQAKQVKDINTIGYICLER